MRQLSSTRKFIALIVMTLLLAVATPSTSFGKQRGKWRHRGDRDNWNWSGNRKCGKFVNCHDARDGRWDGRGPRRNRFGNNVWWNGYPRYGNDFRYRRYRTYDNRYWWRR